MASVERVLLLRAPRDDGEQDPYTQVFAESGIVSTSISPLSFDFMNLEALYSHLSQPEDFTGLVFSSARTVQAVKKCKSLFSTTQEFEECIQKVWALLPAYTVGTATALAARDLGLSPLGEDSGSAVNLVKKIKEGVSPGGKPLLIPRGEMAREELTGGLDKAGICYTVDTVYKTVCCPNLEGNVKKNFATAAPDVLVFFSPSGVQFSADILKRLPTDGIKFVSIGPTTTSAMDEAGYKVTATAPKPNPQSLLKTILEMKDNGS